MEMALIEKRTTPKPKYKNTVVCPHCHAEYQNKGGWRYGYSRGTTNTDSDNFVALGNIPADVCPLCRR